MIKQLKHFVNVHIPRSIEIQIQECAIEHLGVPDMYKLRDKYEGQRYYDQLRNDIIAEFAFEKYLNLGPFDWEKRRKKNYLRKSYVFESHKIDIINFNVGNYPLFDPSKAENAIFVYIKPERKTYVSGIAKNNIMNKICHRPNSMNPLNLQLREVREFEQLIRFQDKESLLAALI